MKLKQFLNIQRALSLRYPTHRAIIILASLAGAVGLLYQILAGAEFQTSVNWALLGAFNTILMWALAREIDPDHEKSAFLGLVPLIPLMFILGPPAAVVGLYILLLIRRVNHSPGPKEGLFDMPLIIGLGAYLLWLGMGSMTIIGISAFAIDSLLVPKRKTSSIGAGAHVILLILAYPFEAISWDPNSTYLTVGILAMTALLIFFTRNLESKDDSGIGTLRPGRVWAGQLILALSIIVILADLDPSEIGYPLVMMSALVGVVAYGIFLLVRPRILRTN